VQVSRPRATPPGPPKGEPILSGIDLNDGGVILQGAVPAALLALGVQWLFDALERRVVSRGLRLGDGRG